MLYVFAISLHVGGRGGGGLCCICELYIYAKSILYVTSIYMSVLRIGIYIYIFDVSEMCLPV
jgi:hypothetical protein